MKLRWPTGDVSFKTRLADRFSVPGTQVICHRRTIFGTWKAYETPFQVYNVGMGGLNFWNLGTTLKPGTKIKLTLLLPNVRPVDLIAVVVWNKAIPRSKTDEILQPNSQITGVKFVDYDGAAWAVLRRIPQFVQAQFHSDAPSEIPLAEDPADPFLTTSRPT